MTGLKRNSSPRIAPLSTSRPLMEIDHRFNDKPVVYLGPHPAARVVYTQLGHGENMKRHLGYRKLVKNAVRWATGNV